MKKLLTDIQARLIAAVPALKYVDIDWGQLSYYNPHPPVQWPCALIGFNNAQWSNVLKGGQLGLVQLTITLADVRLSNSSGQAPQSQKDKALAMFDTVQDVFKSLHGWTGDISYNPLCRTLTSVQNRDDGIMLHLLTFTTELKDKDAIQTPQTAAASPKVTFKVFS